MIINNTHSQKRVCVNITYKEGNMHRLFKSALIVTFFSVATRALGFVLRIILSRALGAEVLGNYQVAMSVFGVLMTLVASGLPLVVSRSVAYNKSLKKHKEAFKNVSAGLIIAISVSVVVSLIITVFPDILNLIFIKDNISTIVLYSLPALIASSIYSILRSSLWGDKHFFAISFTEFFEQVIRIIFCLILFSTPILPSLSLGDKASLSLSIACIFSATLVVIIYFSLKQKLANPKSAFKPLLKSSLPITTLRTVSSLVQSLIAIIIPSRLMLYGYSSSEAMAQFGMLLGMAFPLIMIPGTLIGSVAVTLVPEISSKTDNIDDKSRTKDLVGLKSHIYLGITLSSLISMIFVPAFLVLGEPICEILFNSSDAGKYVSCAAIIMLPLGINQITSSILNSIGLEFKSLMNYAIGAVFLFVSIFFLPKYIGSYSLIVGLGLLNTISSFLNMRMLSKRDLLKKGYIRFILISIAFSATSALLGYFIYKLLISFIGKFISTMITGFICVLSMILLYYVFNISNLKGFILIRKHRRKHK